MGGPNDVSSKFNDAPPVGGGGVLVKGIVARD
jgi:hypothetical protein